MTIYKLLEIFADAYGAKPAFVYYGFEGKTEVSAQQFFTHINKAALYWKRALKGSQNRIGIVGENSYQYLVCLFGIMCSGNIAVPFNQTYETDVIKEYVGRAQISLLICDTEFAEEFVDMDILVCSMEQAYENIMELPEELIGSTSDSEDTILILHSSGTSGKSKLVQITNQNLSTFPECVWNEKRPGGKNSLLLLPFYHISGIIPLLEDMMRGNVTHISSAKYLMRDIGQYSINKLIVVPAMMKRILGQCERKPAFREQCESIKEALCLGSALEADVAAKMLAMSIEPKIYYGMTETTGTVSGWGTYKEGACGRIEPFCEVKIEDGEILVRGKNVMKGYFLDEEETKKILEDGWIHTGDLGYVDDEGYLYLKGRKKNIIILSNGENVSPEELENKLYQCSNVTECRVYGEEDKIKAQVYCEDQSTEAREAVLEHIKEVNRHLPPAWKISYTDIQDKELAKNSMGKLLR